MHGSVGPEIGPNEIWKKRTFFFCQDRVDGPRCRERDADALRKGTHMPFAKGRTCPSQKDARACRKLQLTKGVVTERKPQKKQKMIGRTAAQGSGLEPQMAMR